MENATASCKCLTCRCGKVLLHGPTDRPVCLHGTNSVCTVQAASVVAVLLAGLTRLGGNAYIAKRLIMMLAAHAPCRSALRTACARWRAQATGLQDNADGSNAAAVQWAISRLWQQGQAHRRPCLPPRHEEPISDSMSLLHCSSGHRVSRVHESGSISTYSYITVVAQGTVQRQLYCRGHCALGM